MTVPVANSDVTREARVGRVPRIVAMLPFWGRLFGSIAGVLLVWQGAVWFFGLPAYLLPAPDVIIGKLITRFSLLMEHGWATARVMVIGFGAAILVSIPLALAVAFSRFLEQSVYPIVVWMQIIPKISIAPLFIIWFGFGYLPRILIVFMMCFFPILVNSIAGFRAISPDIMDFARSTGASSWTVFRRIRLPAALPHIFTGLRVAAVLATTAAVVAEFIAADEGLGYLLLRFNGDLDTASSFAAIFVLSALGMTIFYGTAFLERRILPWHVAASEAELEKSGS